MSEQAPRPTAGTRARAAGTQDENRRYAADVHAATHANWTAPRERDLRAVPDRSMGAMRDFSSRADRSGDFSSRADRSGAVSSSGDSSGVVSSRHDGRGVAITPRRTVVIRGQVADRDGAHRHSSPRRRSRAYHLGMRPERAALWAVLLGLALVIAALASAQM
jgi:hypothetical protein